MSLSGYLVDIVLNNSSVFVQYHSILDQTFSSLLRFYVFFPTTGSEVFLSVQQCLNVSRTDEAALKRLLT